LKRDLRDVGIDFEEVDIEQVPGAAELVEKANNGNQTVPTVIFSDGTAMTNPSLASIREHLGA
jgi:mycoredoxin